MKVADTSARHPASTRCTRNPQKKSSEKQGFQLVRTNTTILSSQNKGPLSISFQPQHLPAWAHTTTRVNQDANPAIDAELSNLYIMLLPVLSE